MFVCQRYMYMEQCSLQVFSIGSNILQLSQSNKKKLCGTSLNIAQLQIVKPINSTDKGVVHFHYKGITPPLNVQYIARTLTIWRITDYILFSMIHASWIKLVCKQFVPGIVSPVQVYY